MIIKLERPPLFKEIDAAFKVAGKPVIFAFGDTIYNPEKVTLGPELFAHEAVHGKQQEAMGVEDWWRAYIVSPAFRLREEIPAHIAEFKKLCELQGHLWTSKRNMRRTFAHHVATKLASPLYGHVISYAKAKELILEAA